MADEINVKVSADVKEVTQGMKDAAASLGEFSEAVNTAAAAAQKVNPAAFKELTQELNSGEITAREYATSLRSITPAAEEAAEATKATGDAAHVSSGGIRELIVVGRELASGNLTRLPGSLSILATRLGGIPPQAILAAAAIAGVGYAIYEVIDSSEKAEADLDKIQNTFAAVGRGDQFDRTQVTQYLDDLRQIPGVTSDAANAIVNEFARARNGGELMSELIQDVKPLADLLGVDVPQAAKLLAAALNDPAKGLQDLKKYGVELTASQQEQITQMMAVNDVAGAQAVLLEGITTASAHVVDTTTGLERFWNSVQKGFSGINQEAAVTARGLEEFAAEMDRVGDLSSRRLAQVARNYASLQELASRNLPSQDWKGTSGTVQGDDKAQAAKDAAVAQREQNDAIKDGVELYQKGNSALREQEEHEQKIARLQTDLGFALDAKNGDAAQKIQAQIDQEDKLYSARRKREQGKPDKSGDKLDMAEARGDAEAADARIKTEQDLVQEKLRLGEISTADAVKQLKELAAQEHEINLKRIADMRAIYTRQGDKAGVAKSDGDTGKENARYADQDNKIDAQGAEAKKKADDAEMEGDRRVADEKVRTAEVSNQQKVALGQMSAQAEIQAEIQAANQKHAIDDQYYQSLLTHEAQDSAAYKKTLADKLVAEQKFNQQILQLRTKQLQQEQQQENQLTKSLTNGMNQTVSGVLTGTQTMSQAFAKMGQNIVMSVVDGALDKILTNWLSNNATIQAAQTALDSFLGISNATNATAAVTTAQLASHANILAYAGEGAAAAVASTAAIPLVGPELAPAAGTAIYADIMSYNIASAAGGMIVDGDQIARVHDNEMVLPARYTSGLTGMIDQANAGGGGSGHTFNTTVHANGRLNAGDLDGLHDAVVSTMRKAARNGQFGGMRS